MPHYPLAHSLGHYALLVSHLPWRKHYLQYCKDIGAEDMVDAHAFVCRSVTYISRYTVHAVFGRSAPRILKLGIHIHEAHHAAARLWPKVRPLFPRAPKAEVLADMTAGLALWYESCLLGRPDPAPLDLAWTYLRNYEP